MNAATALNSITTEELLAMPDDGMDRELIDGQLRERPMTRRSFRHAKVTLKLGKLLDNWLDQQPLPRGVFVAGEAGFCLHRDPDTTVGIDLAYVSADLAAQTPPDAFLVEGAPILAVEILSASDKHEEVVEKIQAYLSAGVALVWIVDPDLRTVSVHRPDAEPELFNIRQELRGDPHLPGFRVAVSEIFPSG